MSEIVNLSPSLRSLNTKNSPLVPPRRVSSSYYRLKFLSFPGKISLATERIRAIDARKQEVDDSPVSIELGPISSESHFDEVMEEAQARMAAWCRKCIYLRPKLEKLAAEFYPRLRFYHVDVNAVPYRLVTRAGVTGTEARKCDKCFAYKPLRTHHCRVCRRCVLKMDHHCVWINNCVGYANYKAFFLLVFYATVACIHSTVLLVCCVFKNGESYAGNVPLKTFMVSCGVFMIGLSITLGTLLGWHIYLIAHNMTTIEHYNSKRALWLARKSGQSYRHQFDLGVYKNITSVLGSNIMKWLCPTFTRNTEDGINFSAARDS
ncbi:hypothetical protein Bca52824_069599 [Brassica carinata]|uniref:S-acyltransferase n=1 Tax=Brassica carinata TaxID=52824 RepID=A0A8X7Q2W3_BRACI|nr:hypothetical protein Bca52824_069599 [Brassica carinata]